MEVFQRRLRKGAGHDGGDAEFEETRILQHFWFLQMQEKVSEKTEVSFRGNQEVFKAK